MQIKMLAVKSMNIDVKGEEKNIPASGSIAMLGRDSPYSGRT